MTNTEKATTKFNTLGAFEDERPTMPVPSAVAAVFARYMNGNTDLHTVAVETDAALADAAAIEDMIATGILR